MNGIRNILLVEDDVVDVMTTRRAFKELGIEEKLHVCGNGEEALAFLHDDSRPIPDLILLDINMPKMNGHEFLEVIKADDAYRRIPVVILSTSVEDRDRFDSYNLGASGYVTKPVSYTSFVETVSMVYGYWMVNLLPNSNG